MSATEARYLVVEEVAELLHCSTRTVQELVGKAALPHRRLPGMRRTLFVRDEIQQCLDGAELETVEDPRGGRIVRPK